MSKDMSRDLRHQFAKEYLFKNYGIRSKEQSAVIYKLRDGRKCLLLVGKTETAFQAIRSANFDSLKKNDVIVCYNASTGVMVSFFKQELYELLECGYISWHSSLSKKTGTTSTRLLVQFTQVDGKTFLYMSSSGSDSMMIDIKELQSRNSKSGDAIGTINLLVGGMTYIREAA